MEFSITYAQNLHCMYIYCIYNLSIFITGTRMFKPNGSSNERLIVQNIKLYLVWVMNKKGFMPPAFYFYHS